MAALLDKRSHICINNTSNVGDGTWENKGPVSVIAAISIRKQPVRARGCPDEDEVRPSNCLYASCSRD